MIQIIFTIVLMVYISIIIKLYNAIQEDLNSEFAKEHCNEEEYYLDKNFTSLLDYDLNNKISNFKDEYPDVD